MAEAWLGTDSDDVVIAEMLPTGYAISHVPRQGVSAGYGGVALIHKANISVRVTDSRLTNKYSSFEHM